MKKQARIAAWITAVMTVVVAVLRIALTPHLQDAHTGRFGISFVIIGTMVITGVAAIWLTYRGKADTLPRLEGAPLNAVAWMLMAFGAVMAVVSVYDAFVWWQFGTVPNALQTTMGSLDLWMAALSLVCSICVGVYGIRLGWRMVSTGVFESGAPRLLPLALPLWLWLRLARYVMSYASAVAMTESFYDYAMLVVSLLFAMSLARYLSGVSDYRSPALLWQALLTVLCGVSATVTRFWMYLIGETDAYQASQLATFPDLVLALLAACVAVALLCSHSYMSKPKEMPDED